MLSASLDNHYVSITYIIYIYLTLLPSTDFLSTESHKVQMEQKQHQMLLSYLSDVCC